MSTILKALIPLAFLTPAISAEPESIRSFEVCLAKSGAKLYSAWWCPFCYKQLAMFDPSLARGDMKDATKMSTFPFLVECAGGDGKTLPACKSLDQVKFFPTWIFSDGTVRVGAQPLETIAKHSDCTLPQKH